MLTLRRNNARRGTAAVEFAIVMVPFFLFVIGVLEFGRLELMRNLLTNAAREGARLASVNTDVIGDNSNMSSEAIENEIGALLKGLKLGNVQVEILHMEDGPQTNWSSDATFQHRIAVEIRGDYEPFTPLFYLMSSGTISSFPVSARSVSYSEGH